jgi:CheY-like chemotaxis protein
MAPRRIRVLIVDPDDDERERTRATLERGGLPAMTLTGCVPALEQLRRGVQPYLVVLKMPQSGGERLLELIEEDPELAPAQVVLLLAGQRTAAWFRECVAACIAVPEAEASLLTIVRQILE